ncbi:MAG TPA: ATP-grasp domain-containing protein [Flavobacterium sp.]|nr:ATP-grasp domain-containing protein [Flavobacterium sp.]
MKNILVFPCGNENALEILNSLTSFSDEYKVYGGSSVENIGKDLFKNYIDGIPFLNDLNFIKELNRIIDKFNIDFIFPTHDMVVYVLSKSLNQLNCSVLCPEIITSEIIRDKFKTYKHFDQCEFIPKVYESTENIAFPIFIKPKIGELARNSYKINNQESLVDFLKDKNVDDYVISELLVGQEYTVECFTDSNGELLLVEARQMNKYARGIFLESDLLNEISEFEIIAKTINSKLKFQGLWYFQCKRDINGKAKLLEIAQKVNGTMSVLRVKGINLPYLTLQNYYSSSKPELFVKDNPNVFLKRCFFNVITHNINYTILIVDLDSTLFSKNSESLMMALMYQHLNRGGEIVAFTKQEERIERDLKLSQTFFSDIFDDLSDLEQYNNFKDSILISNDFTLMNCLNKKVNCFNSGDTQLLYDWKK